MGNIYAETLSSEKELCCGGEKNSERIKNTHTQNVDKVMEVNYYKGCWSHSTRTNRVCNTIEAQDIGRNCGIENQEDNQEQKYLSYEQIWVWQKYAVFALCKLAEEYIKGQMRVMLSVHEYGDDL